MTDTPATGRPANHLTGQASPYLAAHAHDPVDWRPWGEDAFALARETDRPIFLSVGYASCHWCHVMQRESFRDPETADYLNEHFVAVKVDRELRPDVDHLYMTYVQVAIGHGGWPMSVFLTPDLRPFLGGTYYPKETPAPGIPTFREVMGIVVHAWDEDRDGVMATAEQALGVLAAYQASQAGEPLDQAAIDKAASTIFAREDREWGGLIGAPKFPQAAALRFLVAYHRATGSKDALKMSLHWTYGMVRSGTYDQVGGGLFRYSTDERWLVPHFEKMLYDSAQLLSVIADLYRIAPSDELAHVARETAAFMRRDLGREGGGFWSSLDAETRGEEGGTYTWTHDDLTAALTPDEFVLATERLGVTRDGNWTGTNVLTLRDGRGFDTVVLDALLAKLADVRRGRPQPALITNALTEWNALAARGLVEAGRWVGDDGLMAQGIETLEWLLSEAVDGDEVLHAMGDPGVADVRLLEDYASIIAACLAVPKRQAALEYRETAARLFDATLERFEHEGTVYMTPEDTELPLRLIRWEDATIPSGVATLAAAASELAGEPPPFLETYARHLRQAVETGSFMVGAGLATALRQA